MDYSLTTRLAAEFLGTALLVSIPSDVNVSREGRLEMQHNRGFACPLRHRNPRG